MRQFFAFEMWSPRNNGFVLLVLGAIPLVCLGWTAYKSIPAIQSATDIPIPTVVQSAMTETRFEYLRSSQFQVPGRFGQSALPEVLDERVCDFCPETDNCYCLVIAEPFFRDLGFDYIPWDVQQIYVDTADLDWERIQADYAKLLRRRGFAARTLSTDIDRFDHIAIWERSRYNGLEGELIAIAWVDQVDAPYLIVILGIDF